LIDLIYPSFIAAGGDRLIWKLDANRLRILCYHGVCGDSLQGAPWVPRYFVGRSAFEAQLQYLRQHACVLPLSEAVQRLSDGTLPARAVSITFDDGYANNLSVAYPLLAKYQIPATVFLSSAYIESGDFYPFLKLKLIQLSGCGGMLPEYKSSPIDVVIREAETWWPAVCAQLTAEQRETLRPMTVEELRSADFSLLEFGAHSHTHCIFRNETEERRKLEVRTSVRKVEEWTGRPARIFSYPNGEAGDFGEIEKQALRAAGVAAAVTGISGANHRSADPLELKRYPLTMQHTFPRFRAEVCGFRSAVRAIMGRRGL
jgi:peptidoglycan/xylan/chitin deacetylase (PgdA/CDA1 family)